VTEINTELLIFCYKRHDFQLKTHHKVFGGRAPLEPSWKAHSAPPNPPAGFRGREKGEKNGDEGREGMPHFY